MADEITALIDRFVVERFRVSPLDFVRRNPALESQGSADAVKRRLDEMLGKDLDVCRSLSELIQVIADLSGSEHDRAIAFRGLAQVAHVGGDHLRAERLYRAAIAHHERLGEHGASARVRKTLIDVLMYLGHYEAAYIEVDVVRSLLDSERDRALLAELDVNLGNLHLRCGRIEDGRAAYARALDVFEENGAPEYLAITRLNLANVLAEVHRFDEAELAYDEVARYSSSDGHLRLQAEARYGRLWIDFLRGRYGDVALHADDVATFFESHRHPRGAILARQLEARSLLELGRASEALGISRVADVECKKAHLLLERARGMRIMGRAQAALGRESEAITTTRHAIELLAVENNTTETLALEIDMAEINLSVSGSLAASRSIISGVLERVMTFGRDDDKARAQLVAAKASLATGDFELARHHLHRARSVLEVNGDPWLRFDAALLDVRLPAEGEDAEEATRVAEAMLGRIDDLVVLAASSELERTLGARVEEAARLIVRRHLDVGDIDAAWDIVRRHLGRRCDGSATRDEKRLGEYRGLVERWHALWSERRHDQARNMDAWRQALDDVEEKITRAARRMDGARVGRTLPLATSEGDAVVTFVVGEKKVDAFVQIHDGQPLHVVCGDVDRVTEVSSLLEFDLATMSTDGVPPRTLASRLSELGRLLVEPWWQHVRSRNGRVILVPDRGLRRLPVAALTVGGSMIGMTSRVLVTPSPQRTVRSQATPLRTQWPPRAAILAAEIGTSEGIASEAKDLDKLWASRASRVDSLDRSAWPPEGSACDVIHVAAHGVVRDDVPEFGGLDFGGRVLHAHEWAARPVSCQVLVLAGCETAVTDAHDSRDGGGIVGVALANGARYVLASVSPVEDGSTRRFMRSFHAKLAAGVDPPLAFRDAGRSVTAPGAPFAHWNLYWNGE